MYKAILMFSDLCDNGHVYRAGDVYPRDGIEVSDERLAELSTDKNRRARPLIVMVPEDKPKPTRKRVTKHDD